MTQKFASSQTLIPFSLNKQPRCLSYQKWTKSLLLLWKFQQTPTKILAKERRLKLSRARIRAKTKRRTPPTPPRRPQTLLSLNPSTLLTQKFPRLKLRLGVFYRLQHIFCFCYVYCFFFFNEMYQLLLLMKISFFCLICHYKYYEIDCLSMVIFCHFDLNRIYCHIVQTGYTS